MPYQQNIPQPNDALSVSQGDLLGNFQALNTAFNLNHTTLQSGIPGLHQFVQMPAGTPIIATTATQIGLYAKTGVSSARPELYFQRNNLAADSGYAISEFGTGTHNFNYGGQGVIQYSYLWTRLPSGLVQIWGTQTTNGPAIPNTGLVIEFPTAGSFPGFATTCYWVQPSLQWANPNGSFADQPLVLVQGSTTRLLFIVTRSNNAGYAASGSVVFTAIGI